MRCYCMPGVPNEHRRRGCPWRRCRCTAARDRAEAQGGLAAGNMGRHPAADVAACGMASTGAVMNATAQRRPSAPRSSGECRGCGS